MKKILFILFATLFFAISSRACDICGCGVNNYYIGIIPQFNNKFFGMRYHYHYFNTRIANDVTQFSRDYYQTIEMWGGWNVGKKLQLLAFVPVNINRSVSDDGIDKLSGLGDVVLVANYKLFDVNSKNNSDKVISHQLLVGGGIKLPTGKFQIDANDPDIAAAANHQLGTGSVDVLLDAMYNVRIGNLGINSSANYMMNTTNKDNFKFGNKLALSSFVFYAISSSKFSIAPNVGLLIEHSEANQLGGNKVDLTGGSLLQGAAGVEISYGKTTFGFNAQLPIAQNFAQNQTMSKFKSMAHVTFAF
jgi:hypothetical protein